LGCASTEDEGNDVEVESDGTIIVAGASGANNSSGYKACYWSFTGLNSINETTPPTKTWENEGRATAIILDSAKTGFALAGYETVGSSSLPCYWKDNAVTYYSLPSNAGFYYGYAISNCATLVDGATIIGSASIADGSAVFCQNVDQYYCAYWIVGTTAANSL